MEIKLTILENDQNFLKRILSMFNQGTRTNLKCTHSRIWVLRCYLFRPRKLMFSSQAMHMKSMLNSCQIDSISYIF